MKCQKAISMRMAVLFVIGLVCFLECHALPAAQSEVQSASDSSGSQRKIVLSVQRNTVLHPEVFSITEREIELKGETLITGIEKKVLRGVLSGEYWLVEHSGMLGKRGWVPAGAVVPVLEKVNAEIARAEAVRQNRRDTKQAALSENRAEMLRPKVLDLQSDRSLAEAWDRLDLAIKENESLPEAQRLPEPYLARAAIWSRVQRHDEAIQDYFEAFKYAQRSGRDLQELSTYFEQIHKSFASFRVTPAPPAGKESLYFRSAASHFDEGLSAYLKDDFSGAFENFNEAVQILPDNPSHWYARAICHRNMGDAAKAQHDVLIGVLMERQLSSSSSQSVNWSLRRIQGPDRVWLEEFRLGGSRRINR